MRGGNNNVIMDPADKWLCIGSTRRRKACRRSTLRSGEIGDISTWMLDV